MADAMRILLEEKEATDWIQQHGHANTWTPSERTGAPPGRETRRLPHCPGDRLAVPPLYRFLAYLRPKRGLWAVGRMGSVRLRKCVGRTLLQRSFFRDSEHPGRAMFSEIATYSSLFARLKFARETDTYCSFLAIPTSPISFSVVGLPSLSAPLAFSNVISCPFAPVPFFSYPKIPESGRGQTGRRPGRA